MIKTAESKTSHDRFAYPINDACHALGIKRTSLYLMIRRREIAALKIAGRTVIPRSEIQRLTTLKNEEAA